MRLLVVEDDDSIGFMLEMWAGMNGHEIRLRSGDAQVDDADIQWCSTALVDAMMPGVGGCGVLERVARVNPRAQRVLWSAALRQKCVWANVVLEKPIDLNHLTEALERDQHG